MSEKASQEFKEYPERFLQCILFGLSTTCYAILLTAFIPVFAQINNFYPKVSNSIVILSNSIMFLFPIISAPISNYVLDKYGIQISFNIFNFLFLSGAWLRCLVNFTDYGFYFTIASGVLTGFGSTFLYNSLNLIAATWFTQEVI